MLLSPRKIFLIDAIGALLSSSIIIFGIFYFESFLAMPPKTLTLLAVIPVFYAIYSFICFLIINTLKKVTNLLKIIAFANLSYCVLTLILCFYHFQELTILELSYFILEITTIVTLAFIELKVANNKIFK
jgi:hypothetical protein